MTFPVITHHGGTRGVTGSCHQLHLDSATSLLVDCGLEQGADARPDSSALGFDISGIQALVITHVHLDHVGRIPALLAAGFRGPIFCSVPSAKLLPLVLEDAFKLGISSEPAQVARFLHLLKSLVEPIAFGQWHSLVERAHLQCGIRLQRAGHLLGSAYVECDVNTPARAHSVRVVFSGDIGAPHSSLLRPVQPPERADVLVLESTYGDRLHPDRSDRRQRLEAAIDRALADQGTILIPAFSLGRTQELLYEIEEVLHLRGLLDTSGAAACDDQVDWAQLPIILDSPLAQRVTQVYRELHQYWNDEARLRLSEGRKPLGFSQLVCVGSHAKHQQVVNYLKSTGRPAIVIAGNGMCSGGRIVNYLKAMLSDPRHEVVFVGYQVSNSPGAVIRTSQGRAGASQVSLDGHMHVIRAKVVTLHGYSAHADQAGLVAFASGSRRAPESVFLVHGEPAAKDALRRALQRCYQRHGWRCEITVPK